MVEIVWLALLFPALGFLVGVLVGRWLPPRLYGALAVAMVGLAFLVALGVWLELQRLPAGEASRQVQLWTWILSGGLRVPVGLLVDPLSGVMLLVVTGVGFLIHLYALGYMAGDAGYRRFFAYLNLFVLAMLLLVLADSFLLLMVGWGGVGFCSYALIAHWFERPEAAQAGVKAFVTNAVGDVGLLLAVLLLFRTFGRLDYAGLFSAVQQGQGQAVLPWVALALLVAATAKSAQLPLHVWLPDAMAGPTPVSALIHAATMVTAGVYLIARAHPLYEAAGGVLTLVAVIGAVTAFFAATLGLVQTNIKRVLAYSTISQLGYMFLGVGVGAFAAGIFHLVTHAFFKALLFLAAGGVIHALHGEEDLRRMGGLRTQLPTMYWTFLIGAAALAGLPPLSGFFSKDEILAAAFVSPRGGLLLGLLGLATTALTGLYIFRAVFLAFHGTARGEVAHLHRPGMVMTVPVLVLALLSGVGGALGGEIGAALHPVFSRYGGHPLAETGLGPVAPLAVLLALGGVAVAYIFYVQQPTWPLTLADQWRWLYRLLLNGYYVDALYSAVLARPGAALAAFVAGPLDQGLIDGIVNGVARLVRAAAQGLSRLQTGYVRNYALAVLAGAVVIVAYLLRVGGR